MNITARRITTALATTIALSGLTALPAAAANGIKIGNRSQFTQTARQVIDNSMPAQGTRAMGATLANKTTTTTPTVPAVSAPEIKREVPLSYPNGSE